MTEDKLSFLMENGMPISDIKKYLADGFSIEEIADSAERLIACGEPITAPQASFVGFVGFVGQGANEIDENGFCGFCGFCGPDLTKNPIFPATELPDDLRNFTVLAGESLQVSVDMPSVAVLAALSIGGQRKFKVHPKSGWYEPVNLYTAVVAPPSERKSPVISLVMDPVYQYERDENERRRPAVEEYRAKRDMILRRIESLKKMATSGKNAKNTPAPTTDDIMLLYRELEDLEKGASDYIHLTADDITMEALVSKMASNGEKMALVSSEGGIFNVLSGLYTGGKGSFEPLLKAYTGDHLEVDRKGRPAEYLMSPCLTVLLMVQPNVLEAVMNNTEFAGRGLNSRFMYAIPVSPVGTRKFDTAEIPPDVTKNYHDLIYRLLAIPDTGEPRIIELTEDARDELRKIHYEIEPRLVGDLEPMGDWAGKYLGGIVRIAGLLHICDHVEEAANVLMAAETIRRAKKIGEYFLAHAQTAYQMFGISEDQATKDAKYIIKRLDSTGKTEISKRDLFRLCQDRVGMETIEQMEPGLEVLVKRGYIKIENDPSRQNQQNRQNPHKGGRPRSPMIYVNPKYTKLKEGKERNADTI